jgi:hypothetical protein
MLQSIITPVAVLLLAVGASYATTRPIGDLRRHIAAVLMILALGFIGAVIGGVLQEAAFDTALAISVIAAVLGGSSALYSRGAVAIRASSLNRNLSPAGIAGAVRTITASAAPDR